MLMQAFEATLVESLNPMNSMLRDFGQQSIKSKAAELDRLQLENIDLIATKLAKANEDKAPASVIAAYEKILNRYA